MLICWETVTVSSSEWHPLGHIRATTWRVLTSARPASFQTLSRFPRAAGVHALGLPLLSLQPRDWARAQALRGGGAWSNPPPEAREGPRRRQEGAEGPPRSPWGQGAASSHRRAPPSAPGADLARLSPPTPGSSPASSPAAFRPISTGGSDLGSGAEAGAHLLHQLLLSGEVVAGICLPRPQAELDQWPSSPMRGENPHPHSVVTRGPAREGDRRASHVTPWRSGPGGARPGQAPTLLQGKPGRPPVCTSLAGAPPLRQAPPRRGSPAPTPTSRGRGGATARKTGPSSLLAPRASPERPPTPTRGDLLAKAQGGLRYGPGPTQLRVL